MVRGGKICRYDGTLVESPESLRFSAKARGLVPRLVQGIRVLEQALRTAWAETKSWKTSCINERAQYEAALARHAEGHTGPLGDLDHVLHALELGVLPRGVVLREVQAWAVGKGQHAGVYNPDLIRAERENREAKERSEDVAKQLQETLEAQRALLEELRLTKKERAAIVSRVVGKGS